MILGIGTDVTQISRIAAVLAEHDMRFVARCFATAESDYVESRCKGDEALRAGGYAKRWAAKEACAKALGLGIRDKIYLKDIIVVNDSAGKPTILLEGGAAARLAALTPPGMAARLHASLSDDGGVAQAFIIIEAAAADPVNGKTL